jgi:hypothetical protein
LVTSLCRRHSLPDLHTSFGALIPLQEDEVKMRSRLISLMLVGLALCAPASAGIIFDDGATDGFDNGFFIDGPNPGPFSESISNGFVATATGNAANLDFGIWVPVGTTLTTVTWWLGTSAFAGDMGTATVTNFTADFHNSNGFGYDVYTIHINGMTTGTMMAGNTYWLTLGNANDSRGTQFDAWDIPGADGGPAVCNFAVGGVNLGDCGLGGESFILYAPCCGVPEPGSLIMLATGILGAAGALRRKLF